MFHKRVINNGQHVKYFTFIIRYKFFHSGKKIVFKISINQTFSVMKGLLKIV